MMIVFEAAKVTNQGQKESSNFVKDLYLFSGEVKLVVYLRLCKFDAKLKKRYL